jgi:ATP-dependent DNA ligase
MPGKVTAAATEPPDCLQERLRARLRGHRVKRLGSPYRSGRNGHWVKVKNPAAPAAQRLEDEDWETYTRR